jgi:hypothetical protein
MTYLIVTMSQKNFGIAKNAKNIILMLKSPAANAIETKKIKIKKRRSNTKKNIKNITGSVICANIKINT